MLSSTSASSGLEATAGESCGQRRPGEHRQPGLGMPAAGFVVGKQRPGELHLDRAGQAQTGRGSREPGESALGCVFVGRSDPLDRPVGGAECNDTTARLLFVERFQERAGRNRLVVPVQQIQIDVVGPEPLQALTQVGVNRVCIDPGRAKLPGLVHTWVATFGDRAMSSRRPECSSHRPRAFSLSPSP